MKKTFNVKGMHCNSCAMLIEKELEGRVNSVKASFADEKAEIDFDENKISEKEIKEAIKKLGYDISDIDSENTLDKNAENEPDIDVKDTSDANNKKKKNNQNKLGWVIAAVSAVLFLAAMYFLVLKDLNLNISEIKVPELGEKTSLILLFVAGILTGFHCISMCGGFVVSYTAKNALKGHKSFRQHLVYGGSKVLSYAVIGGVFGLIGGVFAFSTKLRGVVTILAGAFMILYAFSMFGIKFFRRFQINPKFLTKLAAKSSSKAKGPYKGPFFTGLLSGLFIACGPLQAMYLYATGTGNFLTGALSLTAFGLGTLPIMLGFGSLATVISHKTTAKILKISAVIVLILGLIMLNRGLSLTGSSFNFDSIKSKIIGGVSSESTIQNGIQEVNMDVDRYGYNPNSFVIKKGVPVKWNINVKQLTGCNQELIMSAYGIDIKLKQGANVVEFTPDKIGTIQFSCGMGMLRGSFVVTESGAASRQQLAASTPTSGGSCSTGANGGGCGCGG